jgi:hypothetical protein
MKRIVLFISIGLISFFLGWIFNELWRFAEGMKHDTVKVDSLKLHEDKINQRKILTDIDQKKDPSINYSTTISGRFILKEANCAGFDFIGKKRIIWRNELTCFDADTFAIYWLDNMTFITKDIKRINKDCPPRNWIYTVDKYDGENLILNELWTGWGEYKWSKLEFIREKK